MRSRNINRILLIFPPSSLEGVGMEQCFIPNGILNIASYLNTRFPKIEIKIIDGSVNTSLQIIQKIKKFAPDIVGLSILLGNYKNALTILDEAKKVEAITVVGNHHARYLKKLLKEYPQYKLKNIDYIISSINGEIPFFNLINNLNNHSFINGSNNYINKLNANHIIINQKFLKNNINISNYKQISNFKPYYENYNKIFDKFHEPDDNIKQINVNYIKGCYQGNQKPCIYCCLNDHKIKYPTPEFYWDRISDLIDNGFNYIFETCNSLSSLQYIKYRDSNYLKELSDNIPSSIRQKFRMMVYARANEINDDSLRCFKEMGVHRVIFGFDSGDDDMLKHGIKKNGSSANINIEVAKKLNDAGIQIYACYVPGGISETLDSLKNTYDQINCILELPNTAVIEYTSLAPMPGSHAWQMIKKDFRLKYGLSDYIDIKNLSKFWLEEKAKKINWDIVEEYRLRIKNKVEKNNKIFGGYY